jgi:hypothetical protein
VVGPDHITRRRLFAGRESGSPMHFPFSRRRFQQSPLQADLRHSLVRPGLVGPAHPPVTVSIYYLVPTWYLKLLQVSGCNSGSIEGHLSGSTDGCCDAPPLQAIRQPNPTGNKRPNWQQTAQLATNGHTEEEAGVS